MLNQKKPTVYVLNTIKGKGISMIEGHGKWHHKIPNKDEVKLLKRKIDLYDKN